MFSRQLLRGLILSIFFCISLSSAGFAQEYSLTILHTNDHHGHFQKFSPYPVSDVGGLAAQSTLVNITRAEVEKEGGRVLVLSAGDVNTGVPDSDLLDAEPDFKLMNLIGYDAMTLGNHEFDNPLEVLMKQQEWADFPFLAANVVKKDSGDLLVKPYHIADLGGLKVAILGLITTDVPTLVMPDNVKELEFRDVIETARELVPRLRAEADLVIALTHLGLYDEDSQKTGDRQLAKAVPDLDVIIGGHTHTAVEKPLLVGKTLIVQADGYSEYVGRLNLVIDKKTGQIKDHSFDLLPVNGKKRIKYNGKKYYQYVGTGYMEDPEILAAAEPYLAKADDRLSQPIAEALVELTGGKSISRSQETNLGNLITDAMIDKTGADIAFQNGGGIRAGIAPGTITYRDVLTVMPFGNTLTEINMTGAQIMEVLDTAATKIESGGFMHVGGLRVTYNKSAGKAENIMIGDAPLKPDSNYKVVTNNFIASGGDGYPMLKSLTQYDTGFVDADAMKSYIEKLGKVQPVIEGRITIVE